MKYLSAIVLLMVICVCPPTHAQVPDRNNVSEVPDNVVFEKDIRYREGDDRWMLNVIRPRVTSAEPLAAIVLVHGGGWTSGDHFRFTKMGFAFAQEGFLVVTPTYRMIQDAPFPACLHDLKNAIRWVRANARKYNVDPDRIGAYGNSAGGTLALTAAMTTAKDDLEGDGSFLDFSSELQAVVCSGAVGNMLHSNHSRRAASVYRNLAGGRNRDTSDSGVEAVMRRASPSSYIRKDVPPIMLVHGAKDTVVFIDSTDEFFDKMKAIGADITYLRYDEAGHAVMGQKGAETTPAMYKFFAKHLGGLADPSRPNH